MHALHRALAASVIGGFLSSAAGAAVNVTNYNWLQLPANSFTTSVQGAVTATPTQHGKPDDFRWGNFAWIPHVSLTGTASGSGIRTGVDYSATLAFTGQSRFITTVGVEPWNNGASQNLKKFYIQGSTDGVSFTDIGFHDYGVFQASRSPVTVNVDDGTYKAVRVLFKAGDYQTDGSSLWGGPGISTIAPYGNGTVADTDINLANSTVFGTTSSTNFVAGHTFTWPTTTAINSGSFYDEPGQTGVSGDFLPGDYIQLNLNAPRNIDRVALLDFMFYTAGNFNIQYSTNNGATFQPITAGLVSSVIAPAPTYTGGQLFTFTPLFNVTNLRFTDGDQSSSFTLINQALVYASLPEPGAMMALAGLGSLMLLRRRQVQRGDLV